MTAAERFRKVSPALALALLPALAGPAPAYEIGHRAATYYDPDRGDRAVPVQLYYPAQTAGESVPVADPPAGGFPVYAFGHGFLLPVDIYDYLWEGLVPAGFILALPSTEGGLIPDHEAFGLDLAFLLRRLRAEGEDPASPFCGRIAPAGAVGGHSMGGGASVLAAASDASVAGLANLAAAETSPSAISAAAQVFCPALLFAGSLDCVTPPPQHQLPMYDAMAADCRAYAELTGAGHCQFADYNWACDLGEAGCDDPTITRATQHARTVALLEPWLGFALRGDGQAWQRFEARLDSLASVGALTYQLDCLDTAAGEPLQPAAHLTILPGSATVGESCLLRFALAHSAHVEAAVYDVAGRRIRALPARVAEPGVNELCWDGSDAAGRLAPAGVYLLRLTAGAERRAVKLTILR